MVHKLCVALIDQLCKERNNVIFIVLLSLAEIYLGKDINLLTVDHFDDLIGNKWLLVTKSHKSDGIFALQLLAYLSIWNNFSISSSSGLAKSCNFSSFCLLGS